MSRFSSKISRFSSKKSWWKYNTVTVLKLARPSDLRLHPNISRKREPPEDGNQSGSNRNMWDWDSFRNSKWIPPLQLAWFCTSADLHPEISNIWTSYDSDRPVTLDHRSWAPKDWEKFESRFFRKQIGAWTRHIPPNSGWGSQRWLPSCNRYDLHPTGHEAQSVLGSMSDISNRFLTTLGIYTSKI